MVNIRNAVIDDVTDLCNRLRMQDKDEIMALLGYHGENAVLPSFRNSDEVYVAVCDEKLICMFGVSRNEHGGCPWLVGSDEMERIPITFIRESRKYINKFLATYGYLENYVDIRNTLSIQWLRWLGFKIEPPQPYGVEGRLFSRFTGGERKCV